MARKTANNTLLRNFYCKGILIAALLVLFTANNICFAQYSFALWDSIPVIVSNNTLLHPFAGGFNNPQFSDIDIDGDGNKDLFVFDRSTDKVFTFINGGAPGQVDYRYAPEYRSRFPKMEKWALLEDYNNDGKKDLFTYTYPGMAIYRNDYNAIDGLKFTLATTYPHPSLYIFEQDIPAIVDVDGDCDLDILTFDIGGASLWYFRNLSYDVYGVCDTLVFVLDSCWGYFVEGFGNCLVTLNDSCGLNKTRNNERHPGSTTLALDLNGDSVKEVIIGDLTCNEAYMLTNGGTPASAYMASYDPLYPLATPIDLYRFPAAFYVDVNNDGLRDLLAAPNGKNTSENFYSSWFYKNIGSPLIPDFSFQTDEFLQDEMIEVGEGANPAFFDYNADGLLDLVIGNYGYFSPTGNYISGLSLYKNTGTLQSPEFELITRDYANINAQQLLGVYPSFGDMDNDGDQDMMLGEMNGFLYYFENTAASGSPANFTLKEAQYKNIDVGQFSTPQIVDVNRDCLPDLLVGERSGVVNYFQNTGSKEIPSFSPEPTDTLFGGVDIMETCCTGYSTPFLTRLKSSGEYVLLVGSEEGNIYIYENVDGNLGGNFSLADSIFQNVNEGERASISGGDLDGDGAVDLVIGNYGGGVALYRNLGDSVPSMSPCIDSLPFAISIFPNPPIDFLNIIITGLSVEDEAEISIHNLLGQRIFYLREVAVFNRWTIPINFQNYADGVYVLQVKVTTREDDPSALQKLKFVVVD